LNFASTQFHLKTYPKQSPPSRKRHGTSMIIDSPHRRPSKKVVKIHTQKKVLIYTWRPFPTPRRETSFKKKYSPAQEIIIMIILLISPQKLPIKLPPGQEPTTSTHGSSVHPLNYPSIQKKQHPLLSPHFFFYLLIDPLCQKKIPLNKKQKIPFFFTPFFSYNQSKTKTKKKSPSHLISLPNNPFTIHPSPLKTLTTKHTHTHTSKKKSLCLQQNFKIIYLSIYYPRFLPLTQPLPISFFIKPLPSLKLSSPAYFPQPY
jgi:hypothetical protein